MDTTHQRAGVDGSAVRLQQQLHQVVVARGRRQVERREAELGLGVDEGLVPEQDVRHLLMSILTRQVQRRLAVLHACQQVLHTQSNGFNKK